MTDVASRVLIVEDDPLIADFMTKALGTRGYIVTSVGTGTEGVAVARTGVADIVLLDLSLPDLDGLEVLRQVRESHPALPVVIVTSRSDPADRTTAHALGVSGYIVKPFPLADLFAAVLAVPPSGSDHPRA